MISEESCDTEDWSNAENPNDALRHRNKWNFSKYIQIENMHLDL